MYFKYELFGLARVRISEVPISEDLLYRVNCFRLDCSYISHVLISDNNSTEQNTKGSVNRVRVLITGVLISGVAGQIIPPIFDYIRVYSVLGPEEPDGLWIMDVLDLKSIKSIILDLRWIWIYKSKPHGFWMDLDSPKKSMRSMNSGHVIRITSPKTSPEILSN